MCVSVCALSMCQCHQFIFVVVLHFGLFYLTNYKRAVVMVSQIYSCVCVCVCVCVLVCVCVRIVNVSVSPIYFCGGSAFWIILFDKL